jgi:glycosyltransferase involved in cell wall biosynthesis
VPPEKAQVLYSGVHRRFRPQPEPGEAERVRARYGLGAVPYILSVGTLQPRKNYPRLIQAFTRLGIGESADQQIANHRSQLVGLQTCKFADLRLVIAGGRGWLYEETLAEAEKHPARVRILDFVDDGDLPALYRGAALFAFPSLYEGFGLPVLEAMACGVPVVCSNASSLPEVAGDAALLVDSLDTDGLAAAMARALEDAGLRQEMSARGLAQASRFTWEKAARQLLAGFDALV